MLCNRREHSQGFFICFIIKNLSKSPHITYYYKLLTNLNFHVTKHVFSMLYTVIKNATIGQSEAYSCQKCQTIKVHNLPEFTICNSSQTEIVWQVKFNTNTESENEMFNKIWPNCGSLKQASFLHKTITIQTAQGVCLMYNCLSHEMFNEIWPNCGSLKQASFLHKTITIQSAQGVCLMYNRLSHDVVI